MTDADLREHAQRLQAAALAAVDPARALERHVSLEGSRLEIAERSYELEEFADVYVLAGGKASVPLVSALSRILGPRLTAGVGVTKHGHASFDSGARRPSQSVDIIEAGHPVPDEDSVRGAQAILDLAQRAGKDDLVICLLSGGGSALMTLPVEGLDLAQVQSLADRLLRSGATIDELNTVRKHWSRIKGGHLARAVAPATLVTMALSDVVGDPLDVIASGPTTPDPTTVADAVAVLSARGIEPRQPLPWHESPKPGEQIFERAQSLIIASNRLAATAAVDTARGLGYKAINLGSYVEGEAREVAKVAAGLAKSTRMDGYPLPPPACLVWGGETTVTVRGSGKGGRNTELALSASLALEACPHVLLMALATDGTDGPTDSAGAVATGSTVSDARAIGLDPQAALEQNDSYTFFAELGDLIRTGPTGTNVNDLLFILVG